MDLLHIAVRAAFSYVILLGLLRMSGKRTIAQGTPFDLVLALILGDMVDDVLWGDVSAASFVVATGTLTALKALVSWGSLVSPGFERIVSGKATLVLDHGHPVQAGLRGERVSPGELEELLRLWGVPHERWQEVETALIEESGAPSLAMEHAARPAARGDLDGWAGRS